MSDLTTSPVLASALTSVPTPAPTPAPTVRPLLSDVLDTADLAAEIAAGNVTRRTHPTLPLSIYTYSRSCQYTNHWTPITTRVRGLVVDDSTDRVAAWCLPKFFNHGQHGKGHDYAPPLPDEAFEVYDKVDGSLGIVFHHTGAWRAASKGSFISAQAAWAQKYLDQADTSRLDPAVTYLTEIVYPDNRIVVDYGGRRDLVLLAAYQADGIEPPLAEAATAWDGLGTVVRTFDSSRDPLSVLIEMADGDKHHDGSAANGIDAEGWVVRFAGGVRTKVKISEYTRLHRVLTGVNARDVWRCLGVQLHPDASAIQVTQALGCTTAEVETMRAAPGGPLAPLLENVPDEFDAWVRGVCADLTARADALNASIDDAHQSLADLVGDRGAYARAAQACDPLVRAGMFLHLDGRPVGLHVWRAVKPEPSDPFRDDDEG